MLITKIFELLPHCEAMSKSGLSSISTEPPVSTINITLQIIKRNGRESSFQERK